jgi:hypothetical protein
LCQRRNQLRSYCQIEYKPITIEPEPRPSITPFTRPRSDWIATPVRDPPSHIVVLQLSRPQVVFGDVRQKFWRPPDYGMRSKRQFFEWHSGQKRIVLTQRLKSHHLEGLRHLRHFYLSKKAQRDVEH